MILLVEDNKADADLVAECLRESARPVELHVAADGANALAFLEQNGQHGAAPRPDLVMLDLNIPRITGQQFLKRVKTDPDLCSIPVIVFSSSSAQKDVNAAYHEHANCYVVKPDNWTDFERITLQMVQFWQDVVTLPPQAQ